MKLTLTHAFISLALPALLLLASCGGGGTAGTSVTNMGATNVQYGRTITVTANGTGLTETELSMRVDGPCVDIVKLAGGTDLQVQFTCRVNGLGSVVARIRNEDRLEYASLSLNIPSPRVSMTVQQGTRSGTYVVELDPVAAPLTVNNFLAYVNTFPSFYLNTIFHRVVADFVAQAGGYTTVPASSHRRAQRSCRRPTTG
jgi:Cyclophilin type peptidyl-prolyl cis-trans isomerase/CLD